MYEVLDRTRVQAPGIPWPHEVRVALPPTYRMLERAYPVLWVTDGGAAFDLVVGMLNFLSLAQEVPEFVVVGIGAPAGTSVVDALRRRVFDFYPTEELHAASALGGADPSTLGLHGGGAADFLSLLVDDLRPRLSKEFRFDDDAHCLVGHSAGGYFGFYALLTDPAAFAAYLIGSPPLGYCDDALYAMEEDFARDHDDLAARVFVGAGEREIDDYPDILREVVRMVSLLNSREYKSLSLTSRIFPGVTHTAAVLPVYSDGLQALFPCVPMTADEQLRVLGASSGAEGGAR